MIVDTLAILSQYGTSTVDQLRQAIGGHEATGRTSRSIAFTVRREGTKDILTITGRPYIMALETGRKATPDKKPSRDFVTNIRLWLQAKGGVIDLAYAIAQSINNKGTKGTPGIISNVVDSTVDQIQTFVLDKFAENWMFNVVEFTRGNGNK